MLKGFTIPRSIRIAAARRRLNAARHAVRSHIDGNGNCIEGHGIAALKALCVESDARRALFALIDAR